MRGRITSSDQIVTIEKWRALFCRVVRARTACQYDVLSLNIFVVSQRIRDSHSMLAEQTPGATCDPDIHFFQAFSKLFRQSSTGRSLCLAPVQKRASQEIRFNAKPSAFCNLPKKTARRVQSSNSITPSMKTGATNASFSIMIT